MSNAVSSNGYEDGGGGRGGEGGSGAKQPRLPRWTRQEILVLIQGKKVAESRGRGRIGSRLHHMGAAADGTPLVGTGSPLEPKWASVSSYCRRHGVNRGPVQCRKRWSNLAGDFKKIKEWELRRGAAGGGGEESFWVMRNDLRRERKLPGFFDREVYDILDGVAEVGRLVEAEDVKISMETPAPEEAQDDEHVFDSGRPAAEDSLFSDSEHEAEEEEQEKEEERPPVAVVPISERKFDPLGPSVSDQGTEREKRAGGEPEKASTSRDSSKRQRASSEEAGAEAGIQSQLLEVLERNGRMLTAQLEAQNLNCQLDRDQRREQSNGVVEVLRKLADALGKIADKL